MPDLSAIEKAVVSLLQRRLISIFHKILLSASPESSEYKRLAWCTDLGEEITGSEWQSICAQSQIQTINSGFRLLQYKWSMRLYISPEVLNRLNGNIPDVCIKCETHKGTLFHCLWSCSKLQEFWRKVVDILPRWLFLCAQGCAFWDSFQRTLTSAELTGRWLPYA